MFLHWSFMRNLSQKKNTTEIKEEKTCCYSEEDLIILKDRMKTFNILICGDVVLKSLTLS